VKSHITEDFMKCFSELPGRVRRLAREKYKLWCQNPSQPSLSFKRVGKKYPAYSVRIGIGWRAIGFRNGDTMVWFWIGSHPEYERLIKDM